jgi:hypothetical protein
VHSNRLSNFRGPEWARYTPAARSMSAQRASAPASPYLQGQPQQRRPGGARTEPLGGQYTGAFDQPIGRGRAASATRGRPTTALLYQSGGTPPQGQGQGQQGQGQQQQGRGRGGNGREPDYGWGLDSPAGSERGGHAHQGAPAHAAAATPTSAAPSASGRSSGGASPGGHSTLSATATPSSRRGGGSEFAFPVAAAKPEEAAEEEEQNKVGHGGRRGGAGPGRAGPPVQEPCRCG